jgi:hypothetical protein
MRDVGGMEVRITRWGITSRITRSHEFTWFG